MTSPSSLALATRGLRKSYGSRLALDGLDLSVPTGVVYGFLGPNGAGKTTTMRLLTGLLHPDAGTIELLGSTFRRGDRKRLFQVGALVESPSFYPYLNGRQNLHALAAAGAPVPKGRVEELLELVGLRERAKDKVAGYSLGMKQRLGIAGALLSDPQLLLLDEPANGLDPAGIVAMRETLRSLAASGKTVFVSSHLLAEVQVLADVVGIIAGGRLVREGTLESMLRDQGVVRVRVPQAQVAAARAALEPIAPVEARTNDEANEQWLAIHVEPSRAAEVNERLAGVGVFASGLESGTDLEMLFLELTGGEAASSHEGTFGRIGEPGSGGERGMRIFVAGIRKLIGRPASYVSVGLLVGLLGLIIIASATVGQTDNDPEGQLAARALLTFPGAYDFVLSFMFGLGGLVAVIYGAAVAGSEWSWGTLKTAVARGESRSRYMLATFGAIVVMLAVGLLITFILGVGLVLLGASIAGISTTGLTDADTLQRLPAMAARGWFAVVEQAALGFAIATVARSQLAGIGAGIAFYFGETFATIFLPDIVKYMPFAVARASIDTEGGFGGGGGGGGGLREALTPDTALALVAAWLVGSLLLSALFTERAEITN